MDTVETLARHEGPRGEVALRRRTSPEGTVEELVVNGAFAMDSTETATEVELGALARRRGAARVLVGGLGLGYTAAEVLAGTVAVLDVVELEECLLDWARQGLTPTWAALVADPRVRLHAGDVAAVLQGTQAPLGPWDAILLDVDNGPDFLLYETNAGLYTPDLLRAAYDRLASGGVLAVWCQGPTADLYAALAALPGSVTEHLLPVRRGTRDLTYAIYTLTRPPG